MSGDADGDPEFRLETEETGFLDTAEENPGGTETDEPKFHFEPLPASCLSPPDTLPGPVTEADLASPPGLPAWKRIPRTRILVDAFRFRSPDFVYFLTHHHSDHYAGISDKWNHGPIYCSPTTGRLLCHVLGVKPQYVRPIPINSTIWIDGIEVRTMDANHCPGAMCLLFRGFEDVGSDDSPVVAGQKRKRSTERRQAWSVFHCGDFRFDPEKTPHWPGWFEDWNPKSTRIVVDELFLDNTYANPKHLFPRQEVPMEIIASMIAGRLAGDKDSERRTLFLIATYTIGKERVLNAVYYRTGLKMLVSRRKWGVLSLLEASDFMSGSDKNAEGKLPPLSTWFTLDALSTPIHVLPWNVLGESALGGWTFLPQWVYFTQSLIHENARIAKANTGQQPYTDVMAFIPTGWSWELSKKSGSKGYHVQKRVVENVAGCPTETSAFELVQVPYSEHSSFSELQMFVKDVRPMRIVPTVLWGKDPVEAGKRAEKVKSLFRDLVDSKKDKSEAFKKLFGGGSPSKPAIKAEASTPQPARSKASKVAAGNSVSSEVIEVLSDDDSEQLDPASDSGKPCCCPVCGNAFAAATIAQHAALCGTPSPKSRPDSNANKKQKQKSLTDFFGKGTERNN